MPLDHFVSQVHLRNFYSPALGELMYATRKSDLKSFPCNSESVCRIEDGSTNAYLMQDRAVEDFLKAVEPKYNASVAKLQGNKIDSECIGAIAGFVAYVTCCTPAAMRIHSPHLRSLVESESILLDRQGIIPKAPPSLGSKSLSELIKDGTFGVKVDPKFPQALGIDSIVERTSTYGNSVWEILHNEGNDSPYFTSDYPIALESTGRNGIPNWIVPLTPELAIRIIPDVGLSRAPVDLSFSKFTYRHKNLGHSEVAAVNRLIVQCAEDMVFYRDDRKWIKDFIAKHRYFHVDTVTRQLDFGDGIVNLPKQQIVESRPNE